MGTPGHYLLFVINNVGVPSVGKIIQILPSVPEVVMVCPANGGLVEPGTRKLSARVKDRSVVSKVQFSVNGSLFGEVLTGSDTDGHARALSSVCDQQCRRSLGWKDHSHPALRSRSGYGLPSQRRPGRARHAQTLSEGEGSQRRFQGPVLC